MKCHICKQPKEKTFKCNCCGSQTCFKHESVRKHVCTVCIKGVEVGEKCYTGQNLRR